jgi:hypothetical protein
MGWKGISFIIMCLLAWAAVARAADPNWVGALMYGDTTVEARVGVQYGPLEGYIAPRYGRDAVDDDDVLGVRLYGIYNVITADTVANWLGKEEELPEGSGYAGAFGGYKFKGDQAEYGWLAGVRITPPDGEPLTAIFRAIGLNVESWQVEYQRPWTRFNDTGGNEVDTLVVGPLLKF